MTRDKRKKANTPMIWIITTPMSKTRKRFEIAKVSQFVMDEFVDLKKKCKSIVDSKLSECEECELTVEELTHTIEEQEVVLKAFRENHWQRTCDVGTMIPVESKLLFEE